MGDNEVYEKGTELAELLIEAEQRLQGLKGILPSEVRRDKVSMISKSALKAYLIRAGLLHRTADLAEATIDFYKQFKNLPAFVLTRAILETAALFYYFWSKLETAVNSGKVKDADDILMRILFGARNSDDEVQAVNIMTAVDRLDKDAPGVRDIYNDLCEIAHPNWMGAVGHYGESVESPFILYFDQSHNGLPPEAGLKVLSELLAYLLESNEAVKETLLRFKTLHEQAFDEGSVS